MTEVFSAETIDPSQLNAKERAELSESLYRIQKSVFLGLNERDFDHYLVNSPAQATRILLYRDKQNRLIGYFGVHRFEKQLEGQPISVFRGEVGLLPGYRQRDAFVGFWLTEAAKFKLLNPRRPVYFLAAPVNPSSYAMLAGHTHRLYPRHDLSLPPSVLTLMTNLAQQFGLAQVDGGNPLIRKVGWITRATDHEKAYWQSSENPHVRFYVRSNPGFPEGNGLLTLIPLTATNTLLSLLSIAFQAIKKRLRANLPH